MATVSMNRAQIYYEVHSDGPAVAVGRVRGGNAASWWQQIQTFPRFYKTIALDYRIFWPIELRSREIRPQSFQYRLARHSRR